MKNKVLKALVLLLLLVIIIQMIAGVIVLQPLRTTNHEYKYFELEKIKNIDYLAIPDSLKIDDIERIYKCEIVSERKIFPFELNAKKNIKQLQLSCDDYNFIICKDPFDRQIVYETYKDTDMYIFEIENRLIELSFQIDAFSYFAQYLMPYDINSSEIDNTKAILNILSMQAKSAVDNIVTL